MANKEHLKILTQGVEAWNEWRRDNPYVSTDLREVDLSGVDLSGADLREADLSWAFLSWAFLSWVDLSQANLSRTDLSEADLSEADLSGADLSGADLSGAILSGADLSLANLSRTDLRGADLRGADLSQARLLETSFADIDFTTTLGLETCIHSGPSALDYRTLLRNKNLPLLFLQGCGVPDQLIDYLPSFQGDPLQFYSCFISYNNQDEEFAQRLHADLQQQGVRCWFAPHNIQGGKKIYEQIDQAIRVYDKLLLVLSKHSMGSEWVEFEVLKARQREVQDQRRILFPVRLVDYDTIKQWECFDAETKKDLAVEIREYFIPDFTNWKDHDAYQVAFDRLLRDLQAEEPAKE